jgi:hypothetical protein
VAKAWNTKDHAVFLMRQNGETQFNDGGKVWLHDDLRRAAFVHARIAVGSVALLAVSACGNQTLGPAVALGDAEVIEGRANAIDAAIAGTGLQREAQNYLTYLDLNRGLWDCLEGKGIAVRRGANFLPLYEGWTPNATSGAWMGALHRAPSTTALAGAATNRAAVGPPEPGTLEASPEYDQAVTACLKTLPSHSTTTYDADSRPYAPDGSEELSAEFHRVLMAVEDELGPIEPYNDCMKEAGFELEDPAGGFGSLWEMLSDRMGPVPVPGERPSDKWVEYLTFEGAALDADANCRSDAYRRSLLLLSDRLEDFEKEHGSELATMREQWRETLSRARDEGMPDT